MSKLMEFLTQLAEAQSLMVRFQQDPRAAMSAGGVAPEDQENLLRGTLDWVRVDVPNGGVSADKGSLTVVGTGIKAISHLTTEARIALETAEKLFYSVADPITEYWLCRHNSSAESLMRFYGEGKARTTTYLEMVDCVLAAVRAGRQVCVAFYGHPGMMTFPAHEALRRARQEGYPVKMYPGISAEDCLMAELGYEPGESGWQSFEASDFLINRRRYDDTSLLIIWQIHAIGESSVPAVDHHPHGIQLLVDRLTETYAITHHVYLYEATPFLLEESKVIRCELQDLANAPTTPISTLCVPPKMPRDPDAGLYRALFQT